jgi:hypothetical protein
MAMKYNLSDLDEMVLTVRNRVSQTYISEAVQAYRSNLFRASVILTWTALTYDLIAKFRELSEHGDAGAEQFARTLDNAISSTDVPKLQQIENGLLAMARQPFEMLNDRELEDLERLHKDRHSCVHPAFASDSTLFNPSPELCRMHIVHVITHVLQQPPVQGKAALARLKVDLLQPSFPIEQEQVTAFLKIRYLNRIKPALVGNFVIVFLKSILLQSDPDLASIPEVMIRCLNAMSQTHSQIYEM